MGKSRWHEGRERSARAHEQELFGDLSDVARPVAMGIGLHAGQAGRVVLNAEGEHATIGAVHVALVDAQKIVVQIEVEPGMEIEYRPVIRRQRWRFYDFWRYNEEKHDNELRPESEWPVILSGVER